MGLEYGDPTEMEYYLAPNTRNRSNIIRAGQLSGDEITRIIRAAGTLSATLDLDEAYESFAAQVRTVVHFDRMALHIVDLPAETDEVRCVTGASSPDISVGDRRRLEETESHQLMASGKLSMLRDLTEGSSFCRDQQYLDLGLRSVISVSLQTPFLFVGCLSLSTRWADAFGEMDQVILECLASSIAPSVVNAQLYRQAVRKAELAVGALESISADCDRLDNKVALATAELGRLTQALEACPSGVMIADSAATIRYVNPAFSKLTGYDAGELIGNPATVLGSGNGEDEGYCDLKAILRSGRPWNGECRSLRKSGEHYWTSRSILPVRDEKGLVTHIVVAEEDISEKKLIALQLGQAQRMESLGYRAAGVTHDLNNLLNVMLGFNSMVQAQLDPGSEAHKYSKMVESLVQRSGELVQQLTIPNQVSSVDGRPFDLNRATLEALRLLSPTLAGNITVETGLQEDLPLIIADAGQVQRAIVNLCLNAADAMPNGGQLRLTTASIPLDEIPSQGHQTLRSGCYVYLSVSDTGIGISQENQSRIFAPYFTTKDPGKGTGLGLSVVAGIVKDHGGSIQVRSELGQGSEFIVYLPVAGPPPEPGQDNF